MKIKAGLRHTAQLGNQERSLNEPARADEAKAATRGRVWATFMVAVGDFLLELGEIKSDRVVE